MAFSSSVSPEEVELACASGDVEKLYSLLSEVGDVANVANLTYNDGVTLFMKTIIGAGSEGSNPNGRYADCCTLLIQGGAELETVDTSYGRTAAHWAVYYHRDDVLSVLIEGGCDMTCPDFEGTSPFHLCIQEQATSCLIVSLQLLPKDILRMPHTQFLLPLHHAVSRNNREICEILVNAGADVNEVDESSAKSALHVAAEINSKGLVDFLMACGAHLDVIDGRGLTPLHIASIVEGGDSLEAIVKRVGGGEVLDLRDNSGLTPLMHAGLYGNTSSVKILVRKKADASVLDVEGRSCLHYAAESSSQSAHECVHLLVRKHKQLLDIKDIEGRSALHACASSGTDQSLSVLLAAGCQLEDRDANDRTPLHWAALNGNSVVMSQLLERGAEVDAVDSQGSTPLHLACQYSQMHSDEPFTDETAVRQELIQQCVELLLRGGASGSAADNLGLQPLHYAAQTHYNLPVVTVLFQYGVDIAAVTTSEHMTALHVAARGSYAESCKYLLEASGGELGTIEDGNGQTALHTVVEGVALGGVAMEQVLVCMELLIQAGLQPDQPDHEMRTPTHVAASYGLIECLQLLERYGANLGMPSIDGATPLHEAAASGQPAALEFLLASEAVVIDVGAGRSKATALHYAVQGGHLESARILIQYGANVNSLTITEDGECLTPFDLCQEEGPVYDLLIQQNAVPGSEVPKPLPTESPTQDEGFKQEQEKVHKEVMEERPKEESDVGGASRPEEAMVDAHGEPLSVPSRRPPTPSKLSFSGIPGFDKESWAQPTSSQPVRPPTPATPPPPSPRAIRQGPGMLKKAFDFMRKRKKVEKETEDSPALASAVGFFASQATMLVAAIVGTYLGDQARKVAEKVALGTAQELKKAAADYEGKVQPLIWPVEEVDAPATATPTPSPTTPLPPTPPPPPPPKEEEDPMERRLRRARAQLDMRKSAGLLAVEELVKAQGTQMRLNRQFQQDRMKDMIRRRKEEFQAAEAREVAIADKARKKLTDRMNKAETESELVKEHIEGELGKASRENEELAGLMSELGVNPRPTVAQWLKCKQLQKKAEMQESLIAWDRERKRREAAILVEQTVLTHRATKHAAWGAKKDLSSQIRALKTLPYKERLGKPSQFFPGQVAHDCADGHRRMKSPSQSMGKRKLSRRIFPLPSTSSRCGRSINRVAPMVETQVLTTPTGFKKVITGVAPGEKRGMAEADKSDIWTKGHTYAQSGKLSLSTPFTSSPTYLRATGPKTVHAERTLHFLPPKDYKAMKTSDRAHIKQLKQQFGSSLATSSEECSTSPRRSALVVRSLDFQHEKISRRGLPEDRTSLAGGARYHSMSDSISGRSRQYKSDQHTATPIYSMNVISTPREHSQMTTTS